MEDYKVRFIKEFKELDERLLKLGNMLRKYDDGTLEFTPTCPIYMLRKQYVIMDMYRKILNERAEIEKIDLSVSLK